MKKGIWIKNLILRFLQGDISLREVYSFGVARFKAEPLSFTLQGLNFAGANHTLWGIIADVFINRVYTPDDLSIEPHDIVVDIGAHRGGFTCFAARKTSNTILAFEPEPENYLHLQRTIQANKLSNVIAYNAAIGSVTGKTYLHLSPSSSRHSLYPSKSTKATSLAQKVIEVDVLSLDDALDDLEIVNFLKMDCEGAEYEILSGAKAGTLSKIRKMAIEIHYPAHSHEIKYLCKCLTPFFTQIKLVEQGQNNDLGYLFARQES